MHHIADRINMTLMELSTQLAEEIGGDKRFWQNKIVDFASYKTYHPDLSIWEINHAFDQYLGFSP